MNNQSENKLEVEDFLENQSVSERNPAQIEINEQKDLIFTAAQKRKVLIDKRYLDQLQAFDQTRENDLLISYFCTIGMDEDDILHNIMNIKEIEMLESGLNQYQYDDMIANPEILTGERVYNDDLKASFFMKNSLQHFQDIQNDWSDKLKQPSFQPQVISQVPKVNRSQLLFPINLADFVYPQGVQVMSANHVIHLKRNHQKKSQQNYNPYLDLLPILFTHTRNKQFKCTFDSAIEKEIMLSNQEGKIYYATCYDYFVDLKSLLDEFTGQGKFEKYTNNILSKNQDNLEILQHIQDIISQEIPDSMYFIPFTMCIVSTQSYKKQFLRILDRLYKNYVTCQFKTRQIFDKRISLEQAINRIVFGIPTPQNKFQYLQKNNKEHDNFVKVKLSDDPNDIVVFRSKDCFQLNCSQLENICVLFCKLPSENILQLFKRILFNTCTIISSNDQITSEKCIQGIMQLFFPLKTGITCVPSLIRSKLEYVKLCNQSVIGVQKKIFSKIYQRSASKGLIQSEIQIKKDFKLQTQYDLNDVQKIIQEENKNQKKENDELQLFENEIGENDQNKNEQEYEESKWQDKLFDIMQDNSCLIALKNKKHHPLQKPIQSICFNSKGKLSYGQGAAQKGQRKQKNLQQENPTIYSSKAENRNGNLYNYGGVTETLNDVELPSQQVSKIKDLIQEAQKLNSEIWIQKNPCLKIYIKSLSNSQQNEKEYFKAYEEVQKFIKKIKEIKHQFFLMIQSILKFYMKKEILYEFKGQNTESGHIKIYQAWQQSMDIFQLIDRCKFRQYLKDKGGETQFYKKLIYYPSFQNFICDKFFPIKHSDNLRQYLVLQDQNQTEDFNQFQKNHIQDEYKKIKEETNIIDLFGFELKEELKENLSYSNIKYNKEEHKIQNDYFGKQEFNDLRKEFKIYKENFTKEYLYFPRYLNHDEIKKDFIENQNQYKQKQKNDNPETKLKELLQQDKSKFEELAPIHDIQYRMASQLLYFNSKVDLMVSWLLLFLGSIDYLTDPFLFMKFSEQKVAEQQEYYKPPEYYQSQRNQNIWLGYIFQKSLRMLINKGEYEFNPKCPLLALLFQYTHKNYYLHQKLIEVVNEGIDQQQAGGQANSGITVSSQYVLYQIHWSEKQIHSKGKKDNSTLFSKDQFYNPYQEWAFNLNRIQELKNIKKMEENMLKNNQKKRNTIQNKFQILNEKYENIDFDKNSNYDNIRKQTILQKINIFKKKDKKNNNEVYDANKQEYLLLKNINDEIQEMKQYQESLKNLYLNNLDNMNESKLDNKWNKLQFKKNESRQSNISEDISPMLLRNEIQNKSKIVFNDLSENLKSFFSLSQIKQSKLIQTFDANIQNQQEDLQLILDLVDIKCKKCGDTKEYNMEQLRKNECEKCKNIITAKIQISIKCEYGVFLIKQTNLIFPKRIRSEVESLLKMDVDKSYRILHQVDLSAFSQSNKNNDSDLYWSLVFWYKSLDLPYQWLAPFLTHLQEFQKPDNYQRSSQISFESCRRAPSIGDEDMNEQIKFIFKSKLNESL